MPESGEKIDRILDGEAQYTFHSSFPSSGSHLPREAENEESNMNVKYEKKFL